MPPSRGRLPRPEVAMVRPRQPQRDRGDSATLLISSLMNLLSLYLVRVNHDPVSLTFCCQRPHPQVIFRLSRDRL